MLKSHIDAVEGHLLSISRVPANAGHSLHKGTPREAFIKEFLSDHLSERVAIGTGEIIDANSRPDEPRNQNDIVIYNRNYPKLNFGGGISGFLVESVVATIEVKSTLDSEGLHQSVRTAAKLKTLQKSEMPVYTSGWVPPSILNYVVAYDGPAQMQTVHKWLLRAHEVEGLRYSNLPETGIGSPQLNSPSLDAVFVLGKGFVYFDNVPMGFMRPEIRQMLPDNVKWVIGDTDRGSLLLLFLFLTLAVGGQSYSWLNALPYLKEFSVPVEQMRFGDVS